MDEDTFSILVASDIHLGYAEKSPELGKDSFVTFEEILMIARDRNVDFVLLGGDLFHENRPSRKTLHSTLELFKKYCLGDRPCEVEIVSDQAVNFGHTSTTVTEVNYQNQNINISMPVFSIHGNHDDPSGTGELSAIDLLSVPGFLNHFGKQTNLEKITVSPVLMKKGNTKLALYGLGSMQDERLHRLFLRQQVTMLRPEEGLEDWFNVMVLHQNRTKHSRTNYIPETFLDDFLDLVIWGHEHECLIEPEFNNARNFFVMQPGSPVATSLCAAESKQKKVAILEIRGRNMKTEIIPLQTVRQMFVENISLTERFNIKTHPLHDKRHAAAKAYLEELVEQLISRANSERSGHRKQPEKPLIRLRIDGGGEFNNMNAYRFGATFSDRVANPEKIIHFLKKSAKKETHGNVDVKDMDKMISREVVEKEVRVEDFVHEYFNMKEDKDKLGLLKPKSLSLAISELVHKQERDAIFRSCEFEVEKTLKNLKLRDFDLNVDSVKGEIVKIRQEAHDNNPSQDDDNEELKELREILSRKQPRDTTHDEISNIVEEDLEAPSAKPKRGRGRGRGRGSTRGGSTRGRKTTKTTTTAADKSTSSVRSKDLTSYFSQKPASQSSATQPAAPPATKRTTTTAKPSTRKTAAAKKTTKITASQSRFEISDTSDDEDEVPESQVTVTSHSQNSSQNTRSFRANRKQTFKFSSSSSDDENPFASRKRKKL